MRPSAPLAEVTVAVRVVNPRWDDDTAELPSVTLTRATDAARTAPTAGIRVFFGQSTTYVDTSGANPSSATPPAVSAVASATLAYVASGGLVTVTDPSAPG